MSGDIRLLGVLLINICLIIFPLSVWSRKGRLADHVANVEKKNANSIFVGETEVKISSGKFLGVDGKILKWIVHRILLCALDCSG
jgi:hypothetical protein